MSIMVIACYRPKPGKDDDLLALMKTHLPVLRAEGLVGDGPSLCGRAPDGVIVEVFQWKSRDALDAAHNNPQVLALWGQFAQVCDYTVIADVAGAKDMFTPLTPIEL